MSNFKVILDLEVLNVDYFCFLMNQKKEKPIKCVKLNKELRLDDKQVSGTFLLPVRVANELYLRSFQYKLLTYNLLLSFSCHFKILCELIEKKKACAS